MFRKIIKFTLFCILFLTFMCYFQRITDIAGITDKTILQTVNGDLQGFCSKRNVGVVYAILVLLGFNYFHEDNVNMIVKYKNRNNYFNKIILKQIIMVSFIVAFIHGTINLIYNYMFIKNSILESSNIVIKNYTNSLLLSLFYVSVLLIFLSLSNYMKNNTSMFLMIIALGVTYYFQEDSNIKVLPQNYISNIPRFIESDNWIRVAIFSLIPLLSYCIIFYFISKSIYDKKEYIK
ncbi:WxPxxD family membrane protein [Clostridium chrysemydis]|uniref:WxPxxD family membrane protein n=1 Tax=Clostridium chrysemydis TaxID=2665504 RepID=UPI0018838D6D|nr:WxPxxD family membrane protein [Clostridium chrysemydis]